MKRFITFLLVAAAALAANVAMAAEHAQAAQGDPARGREIAATVCVACHAADGNGAAPPTNPKLAGQHKEYLFKQMQNFKGAEGRQPERTDPIMNGMIAAYTEAQMRDLAAWFSSQKQTGDTAKNRDTVEQGQKLYRAGIADKNLPACAACHGPTGAGIPAQYPRIGGQTFEYVEKQLKAFRDGSRANDPNKMMRDVALKMTDAEIKAVSDYVAGLR